MHVPLLAFSVELCVECLRWSVFQPTVRPFSWHTFTKSGHEVTRRLVCVSFVVSPATLSVCASIACYC